MYNKLAAPYITNWQHHGSGLPYNISSSERVNQIATGLQSAANHYLALTSHLSMLSPYELPQIVAQIPSPPMNVPMPIRKALATKGENRTIHYLLCSDYELNHTSWSNLQQKYNVSRDTGYTALKGKRRPGGSQYQQKRRKLSKQEVVASTSGQNN